jgi:hypothetical protein
MWCLLIYFEHKVLIKISWFKSVNYFFWIGGFSGYGFLRLEKIRTLLITIAIYVVNSNV